MTDTILLAAHFANLAHRGQVRKYTGRPYITHPCRVAGLTAIHKLASPELVAIAYLHDVIEDCGISHRELEQTFGKDIADGVLALTNPSKDLKLPRKERKRIDREHVANLSRELKVVKLLDRIDNIRELDRNNSFFPVYANESLLLAEVLKDADIDLWNELTSLCAV